MSSVLDVHVNEEQVHLRVDVLHHNLEAVKASSFGSLDLVGEAFNKLFIDDAIGGCKESEDVRYKVLLIIGETVVLWRGLSPPLSRRRLQFVVHLPYLMACWFRKY